MHAHPRLHATLRLAVATILFGSAAIGHAATISRLTPPSELFASGQAAPVIARFLPGQRFDLQATVQPDAGRTIESFQFYVDGISTAPALQFPGGVVIPSSAARSTLTETGAAATCIGSNGRTTGAAGCSLVAGLAANTAVVSQRAYSNMQPGVHELKVVARQSDGSTISAVGNFEIVGIRENGTVAKNIIIMLGDGMGAAHRTAARIMARGYA